MLNKARTIEIYLPTGEPIEVRIARDTVRPLNVVFFSITALEKIKNRIENVNGVYLLTGRTIENQDQVYIGESDNLYKRVRNHKEKKDFWDQGYLILNDSGTFDKAHLHYLESLLIEKALDAERYHVLNGNAGQKSTITEQKEAECLNYYETIKLLIETLNLNVLKPSIKTLNQSDDSSLFIYTTKSNQWNAKLKLFDEKYIVLKGSLARINPVKHVRENPNSRINRIRENLIQNGVLVNNGKHLIFNSDFAFNSPSLAAATISGRHDNGWIKWKDKDSDKTLDDVIRKDKDVTVDKNE